MIVAIDAGNTRIKWGLHDGSAWALDGAVATSDVRQLAEAAEDWPRDARVAICCVAGERTAAAISDIIARQRTTAHWLHASVAACGVGSRYDTPTQLGADRWAALIGARALQEGACVVACAGTATTVDVLNEQGVFLGGIILPGVDLMRQSLQRNTAQLPLARGSYRDLPGNTDDAIVSGCLNAQVGAIERMRRRIGARAPVLLAGGAAPQLLPLLDAPVRHESKLILEGLRRFAEGETRL